MQNPHLTLISVVNIKKMVLYTINPQIGNVVSRPLLQQKSVLISCDYLKKVYSRREIELAASLYTLQGPFTLEYREVG